MAQTQRGQLERDDSNFAAGYNYAYLSAATGASLVKSSPGFLHAIIFNKPVATSVVTIYDSSSASSLTGTVGVITVPSSPMPVSLIYDIATTTGTVINVGTTGSDITVVYV